MKIEVLSDQQVQELDTANEKAAEKLDGEIDKLITGISNNSMSLAVKLYEMEQRKYYKKLGFDRFEDYVESKQEVSQRALSQARIRQLCRAGYVLTTLKERGDVKSLNMPTSEYQCHPLISLSPSQIPIVWKAVIDASEAEHKQLSAALVSRTAKKMFPKDGNKEPKQQSKRPSHNLTRIRKLLDELSEFELKKLFIELQERIK